MLSRIGLFSIFYFLWGISIYSQVNESNMPHGTGIDYKDPDAYKDYNKRRKILAAWQINQLKEGALVVRLKTNSLLISELIKSGNSTLALKKTLEQYAINKNTMAAYKDYLSFCKVYFIYSNSSDSLLNGARNGIFLDSNLAIDPKIELSETFYMLAERDYGYNSSIGFVKEDSARLVKETGNAIRQMAVVLKNKYGHQLKSPFPYLIKEKSSLTTTGYDFPITVIQNEKGMTIEYKVDKTYFADITVDPNNRARKKVRETNNVKIVEVQKQFTYEKLAEAIDQLNSDLTKYYRGSPTVDIKKLNKDFLPYLY